MLTSFLTEEADNSFYHDFTAKSNKDPRFSEPGVLLSFVLKSVLSVECCQTCQVIVTILSVSNCCIEQLLCSLRIGASQ